MLLVGAAVAGCAQMAPSVYRAQGTFSGAGYKDRAISEGVWEVTYTARDGDRDDYARRYARYRAAELASQAGYTFFQIVRVEEALAIGGTASSTTIKLTVQGARSRPQQLMCEYRAIYLAGTDSRPCEIHSTEEALRQYEPVERSGPPATENPAPAPN